MVENGPDPLLHPSNFLRCHVIHVPDAAPDQGTKGIPESVDAGFEGHVGRPEATQEHDNRAESSPDDRTLIALLWCAGQLGRLGMAGPVKGRGPRPVPVCAIVVLI